jgi:hypothetical protein
MTALPPDPDPDRTPGLEPGGGVAPGDTPPEAGQTAGVSHPQPVPSRRGPVITLVVVGLLVLLVLGLTIVQILGIVRIF